MFRGSGRRLRPRAVAAAFVVTWLTAFASVGPAVAAKPSSTVHVKFADASEMRLHGKRFSSGTGADVSALHATLDRYPGAKIRRLFTRGEEELESDREALGRKRGAKLADLNAYFVVALSEDGQARALVSELAALNVVQTAYLEPVGPPPPVTADFSPGQGFRTAGPAGIDALYAAQFAGGTGDRVKVLDVEYSWNRQHEDLGALGAATAFIANGTPTDPYGSDHGTATMGELVGTDNGLGVTGLVPHATPRLVNAANAERGWDIANAIAMGAQSLTAGDVMMIEQQAVGALGGDRYVPVEWIPAVYDAISYATAAGIIVVEAAGNGSVNLDAPENGQSFPQGKPNSGAIIVGAGAAPNCSGAPARSRKSFSTYGSRVDLQGWGECVTTTGYGQLFSGGANSTYTSSFNGTSSATPIVAAAAASLSSAYEARHGRPPSPAEVRSILRATGTPQETSVDGNIGPLPNLAPALRQITLAATVDQTAPAVSGQVPSPGASAVAPASTVQVAFSEPMDKVATQGAFSLTRRSDGTAVPGTFSWTADTLTFDPAADLSPGTEYEAQVAATARDMAGNELEDPVAWTFRTAPAPASQTVNDATLGSTSGTFSYAGTWRTSTGTAKHMGDDHYSSTTGSSYTFRFSGNEVALYGAKAGHHGQATVQIDGGATTTIDQYSATRQENVLVYRSPVLSTGEHTVKVTVKGTRNAAATGNVITVDRAVASTVTPVSTMTVNDSKLGTTSGTFSYAGTWGTSTGSAKYMGDDHYSNTTGSSYTFRFTGSRVALFGAKAGHHGQATVQIDGGAATTVDQYSSTRQENVLMYQSPALADGEHVVKVTVKGSRSAAATGYVISVDRAVVTR